MAGTWVGIGNANAVGSGTPTVHLSLLEGVAETWGSVPSCKATPATSTVWRDWGRTEGVWSWGSSWGAALHQHRAVNEQESFSCVPCPVQELGQPSRSLLHGEVTDSAPSDRTLSLLAVARADAGCRGPCMGKNCCQGQTQLPACSPGPLWDVNVVPVRTGQAAVSQSCWDRDRCV